MGIPSWDAIKDPSDELDYAAGFLEWLGEDTIADAEWTAPSGVTVERSENTTTTATVWISGGTAGVTYPMVCKITTAAGRVCERTIKLKVKER